MTTGDLRRHSGERWKEKALQAGGAQLSWTTSVLLGPSEGTVRLFYLLSKTIFSIGILTIFLLW